MCIYIYIHTACISCNVYMLRLRAPTFGLARPTPCNETRGASLLPLELETFPKPAFPFVQSKLWLIGPPNTSGYLVHSSLHRHLARCECRTHPQSPRREQVTNDTNNSKPLTQAISLSILCHILRIVHYVLFCLTISYMSQNPTASIPQGLRLAPAGWPWLGICSAAPQPERLSELLRFQ